MPVVTLEPAADGITLMTLNRPEPLNAMNHELVARKDVNVSRILITGCSKGLGRATALELARRGHEVIATARKLETLADLPVAARVALDVTSDDSVRLAVEGAGPVDVLVTVTETPAMVSSCSSSS